MSTELLVSLPVALAFMVLLIMIPKWQVRRVQETTRRIELETEARKILAQIGVGLVVIVGASFTWRTVIVRNEEQLSSRFLTAIGLLESEHLAVRVGSVYALERVANSWLGDQRIVSQTLVALVQDQARLDPLQDLDENDRQWEEPPLDVQAALTVLGRQTWQSLEATVFDLYRLQLRNVDLRGARLARANLWGTNLSGADLRGASLPDANLGTSLFYWADLRDADLSGANLEGAIMWGARVAGARFTNARLHGAVLSNARGLVQEQINHACTDEHTSLPDDLFLPPPCADESELE